jgi:hypothetical protein
MNKYKRVSSNYRYSVWLNMMKRCTDPHHAAWKWYGARGVTVCEKWTKSFAAFVDDMGDRPSNLYSIDRIDNLLGYSPDNCRWATSKEQARNRRPMSERRTCIRVDGLTFAVLAKLHGLGRKTLEWRYRAGKRGPDLIAPARPHRVSGETVLRATNPPSKGGT